MPRADVAITFGVSLSTIKRLLARRRRDAADSLAAQRPSGRRRTITPDQHPALWAQLEQYRDATIATHADVWNAAQGMEVSQWTVGRAIRRLGWTRKKRCWEPPNVTSTPELRTATR
jgi:transposase